MIQAQQYFGQDECAQLQTEALFEHDQVGRLVGETQRVWQSGAELQQPELLHEYRLTHELDALGFRQRSHLPYAGEVAYLRYGSGHVHGILYNQQPLLDIQRDALHRETERHWVATDTNTQAEHTVSRQQSWDSVGRLQQQTYQGLQLNNLSSFEPLVNLQQRHYHYDALGQLLKIEQPSQSQYYAYDPQGRLAGARLGEHGSPVESWQFDWAGNPLPALNAEQPKPQDWSERVRQHWQDPNFNLLGEGIQAPSEQVAYWPDNRVLYSADTQYQYDAQGNRTQHTEHNGETQRYYYNQLNQLQRVDRYSADNTLVRSLYRYDPLGRRLVKQVEHYRIDNNQLHEAAEPEVEFYGWDGDRLAFTQTEENQWHVIYEPESFTPLLQLQHATDAPISEQDKVLAEVMGSLQSTLNYLPAHEAYELARTVRERTIAQLKANEQWHTPELPEECYFYHCNQLGLPEALTNQNGEAVWAASYDAWGNIKAEHNPNNLHQPIRLPGQYHDTETGLYYNRHRYYDPKLGSYINQDPIGLASGEPNLMAYPRNPVQGVDPLGLEKLGYNWPWSKSRNDGRADGEGCGDEKTDRFVPDNMWGVNFFPACRTHDECYGDLDMTQNQCDVNLKSNLKTLCEEELSGKIRNPLCKATASIFYKAVDTMGGAAFAQGQANATELQFLDLIKSKNVYVDQDYYSNMYRKVHGSAQ